MYGSKYYGNSIFGSNENIDEEQIYPLIPDLMIYLPFYYQNSNITKEIQNTIAIELGLLNYKVEDTRKQFYISTATWGLDLHENNFRIPTNNALSYEDRREIIIAKLRGRGTTTKAMIKNTAESFSGGEVDVIEINEDYRFIVKFVGVKGIPRNMNSFKTMLDNIKPSHLAYEFEYTYITWEMVKQFNWTKIKEDTWGSLRRNNNLVNKEA